MLENITLGHIATGLVFILGIWGSVEAIGKKVSKVFEKQLKPINQRLDKIDKNSTMNFLVRCFGDIDKGEKLDEATKLRMFEQYGYYINELKGNTYIHDTYERLKKEGKI